jgi:hypothetical protein
VQCAVFSVHLVRRLVARFNIIMILAICGLLFTAGVSVSEPVSVCRPTGERYFISDSAQCDRFHMCDEEGRLAAEFLFHCGGPGSGRQQRQAWPPRPGPKGKLVGPRGPGRGGIRGARGRGDGYSTGRGGGGGRGDRYGGSGRYY